MPAVDEENRTSRKWWIYAALGCGGCLFLAVALQIVIALVFFGSGIKQINQALDSPAATAPKRKSPYSYAYHPYAATCRIALPDGSGSIRYFHVLGSGRGVTYAEGQRAVAVELRGQKPKECPLLYFTPSNVRVGLYWYKASNGKGPYLRLYDAAGEYIVNTKGRIAGQLLRIQGRVFLGDFTDGNDAFAYTEVNADAGNPRKVVDITFSGWPAKDVTATFAKDKGQYIGSIVRVRNGLQFVPATSPKRP